MRDRSNLGVAAVMLIIAKERKIFAERGRERERTKIVALACTYKVIITKNYVLS